jgi:hypothetical protein
MNQALYAHMNNKRKMKKRKKKKNMIQANGSGLLYDVQKISFTPLKVVVNGDEETEYTYPVFHEIFTPALVTTTFSTYNNL